MKQRQIPYDNFHFVPAWFLLFVLLVTFPVLTGCSIHKTGIGEPLIEAPGSFSTKSNTTGALIGKWWEQFEDENLNGLMEEAFQNNLDIIQSYERFRQSLAAAGITEASGGLVMNVTGSGGRTRQASAFGATTSDMYSLSAAASYELDIWGKRKSAIGAAHFRALASEQDLKAMFITISARIADLYYLAVEQRAQLAFADRTIASLQDNLNSVERRYYGGLVPGIDVYQARQGLAAAKAQRPLFEATLAETSNALAVLAGRFPGNETGADITELKDVVVVNETGLPSQLLLRRPDIQAALLRIKASDKEVGKAVSDRFPVFSLTGSYGGASDSLSTILDSPNIFWNILLSAVQPVLDSGRRKAEVRRTEAVLNERLALYHKTVLNAFKEVEDSLVKISASKERIRMLDETVTVSGHTLRISLERYNQGLNDYLPVLGAQQRYVVAMSGLLSAKRQLISNRIQLARSLGGEWVDEAMKNYRLSINND